MLAKSDCCSPVTVSFSVGTDMREIGVFETAKSIVPSEKVDSDTIIVVLHIRRLGFDVACVASWSFVCPLLDEEPLLVRFFLNATGFGGALNGLNWVISWSSETCLGAPSRWVIESSVGSEFCNMFHRKSFSALTSEASSKVSIALDSV